MKCIENEIPFDVPEGWEWCRLPVITTDIFAGGDKPDICEKRATEICNIPIYSNGIENDGLYGYTNKPRVTEPSITISARGTIGFCCARKTPFVPIVRLITITPSKEISLYYLKTVFEALIETGEGSSIPQLTVPGIKPKLIPIPPIMEQDRIQSKQDEILKYISDISFEKDELRRIVQQAKNKILDLAIRGKLVPQDPNDEPASVLLERIRAEKEELIKQGKIKRNRKESIIFRGDDNSYYEKIGDKVSCIDDEIPFDIPENWTWCRLSHISEIIMGSSPSSTDICDDEQYIEFHQGKIYFSDRKISCSGQYTKSITKIAPPNSVLLCVRAPVGEVNITDRNICIGRGLASLKPYKEISEIFLFYWLQAFKSRLVEKATGTTFIAVTTDVVKDLIIPLPPYNLQISIIKTIEEVISQLSQLEKSLN